MNNQQLSNQGLGRLKQLCDEAGMKLTHQRMEIFKELLSVKDHPSAELIHRRSQKRMPTIAIDTVYRTLTTFEELGIIKKLHVSNDRTLFDVNLETHHHFICSRCKTVEDIYWPDFDKANLPGPVSEIGTIQTRHLQLHGVCNKCTKEAVKV